MALWVKASHKNTFNFEIKRADQRYSGLEIHVMLNCSHSIARYKKTTKNCLLKLKATLMFSSAKCTMCTQTCKNPLCFFASSNTIAKCNIVQNWCGVYHVLDDSYLSSCHSQASFQSSQGGSFKYKTQCGIFFLQKLWTEKFALQIW